VIELVEMVHSRLPGRVARVPRQSVRHHERAGWRLAARDEQAKNEQAVEAPAEAGRRRRRARGDE